jgi:hypothetical protein
MCGKRTDDGESDDGEEKADARDRKGKIGIRIVGPRKEGSDPGIDGIDDVPGDVEGERIGPVMTTPVRK